MKKMQTILQTAVDITLIAAPALLIGIAIGHVRSHRRKQNRKTPLPYSISR